MNYEDYGSRDSDVSHDATTSTAILSEYNEEMWTKNNFETAISQHNKSDVTAADTEILTE